MSNLLLIDGENFLHSLAKILINNNIITHKRDIIKYDFKSFFKEITGEEKFDKAIYFGANMVYIEPPSPLIQKASDIKDHQRRLINCLGKQSIEFTKVGKIRPAFTEPCEKCGNKIDKFNEKGVDVGLAVAIVAEAYENKYDKLFIVSSDTDLVPALQHAKKMNKEMYYIAHVKKPINAITNKCKGLYTYNDKEVIKHFENANTPKGQAPII